MVPVEQKGFHVMLHSGLIGRITANAAITDLVANFSNRHVFQKRLVQRVTGCYQTKPVMIIVIVFEQGTYTQDWLEAKAHCYGPPTGHGYLWRPNTAQEANAVKNEFNIHDFNPDPNVVYGVRIKFDTGRNRWVWKNSDFGDYHRFVCEYQRPCQ
ncbi:Hypothetical predicted protein [Mytilus galloprovincialis]|uniref:C-type lectin domain-containing protein n=1 Tax=Mytilus galloprovincialis TaxID=29158 RepID=A0A8B6C7Q7_MYTGA|nr:Hypothetical predicted protein [Mytilus galloprovincialis]